MKLSLYLTFFIVLIFTSCSNAQKNDAQKSMDKFQYSLKTAHPKAQALMIEDFYWSPIEEAGPFGSDDGWEAAYGFREWRFSNKSISPLIYLKELIAKWNYPFFDWNEMDTTKIKEFIISRSINDEATIQKQMLEFKETFKNSADTTMREMSDSQLRQIILSSSQQLGGSFLLGQDNAIIGTGFAQLVLEGKIDEDLRSLTITALKRQLLPLLINRYDENIRDKRKKQLTKMLNVVNKTSS